MFRRHRLAASLSLALAPTLACAHHGQDFLLVSSPAIPHPGNAYLVLDAHAALESADEQAGFEPALLLGVTPRLALELHAHSEKLAGEPWRVESVAPALQLLLTDPQRHDGLRATLGWEYERARQRDAGDNTQLRFTVGKLQGALPWSLNAYYDHATGGGGRLGLGAGVRHPIGRGWALGLEAQGHVSEVEGREWLAGAYWEPSTRTALKFGLGMTHGEDGQAHPTAHVGFVWQLAH